MEPNKDDLIELRDMTWRGLEEQIRILKNLNGLIDTAKEKEKKTWHCDGCRESIGIDTSLSMPAREGWIINLCRPCFNTVFSWVRGEIEYEKIMRGEKKEQDSGPDAKAE